jgi:RNA polymerase sigma-70 factor (sigma-E family)
MKPDRVEFDAYVADQGAALLRFAYVLTGDHHLAEDLVQEALVKVYRRWSRVERADQPGAYVRKAVLRQYLSWRRLRSSRELPTALDVELVSPEADHVERLANRDAVRARLAVLPRQQRAVLVLRFYEDLDDVAISELVGCSRVTVRAHASRGLARLRGADSATHAEEWGIR